MSNETPEYPWTTGPWTHEHTTDIDGDRWDWITCPDGDQPHYGETSCDVRTPEHGAVNTALMTLAPEMGEAILTIADSNRMVDGFCGEMPWDMREMIDTLADKLRAIKGDNNE